MGKRSRHSAKTGDSALYGSRAKAAEEAAAASKRRRNDSDDDAMYNEVDRYHNKREEEEYLRLENDKDGDSDDDVDDGITHGREGVFDLGVGGSSDEDDSDSDDESDDSSDDDRRQKAGRGRGGRRQQDDDEDESSEEEDVSVSSSDDDDDMEDGKTNVLDWGNKKSAYYHGDTADLELGQDEEDAELEEEAGREVVKARLEGMDEGDFLLDDDEESSSDEDEESSDEDESAKKKVSKNKQEEKDTKKGNKMDVSSGIETIRSAAADGRRRANLAKLSKSERLKLIRSSHPELLPLIEHFRDGSISNLAEETEVLCDALLADPKGAEAVGATANGLRYLVTKAMLETSTALNICQYLLLKAESASKKAAAADGADADQAMVEAGLLGGSPEEDDVRGHPVIDRLNQLNDLAQKLSSDVFDKVSDMEEQVSSLVKAAALMKNGEADDEDEDNDSVSEKDDEDETSFSEVDANRAGAAASGSAEDSFDESSSDEDDEEDMRRRVVTEAKFALRSQDIAVDGKRGSKSNRTRRRAPISGDFGDEDGEEEAANAAGRKLASTVNSISQRANSKKKKRGAAAANAPEAEDDEQLMRGLAMMDAEFGDGSDDDGSSGGGGDNDSLDGELDDDLGDDFYSKIKSKSKAKKDLKKSLYTPAPKFPNVEGEIDGERAIGRAIMRNRGLVAHKSKLNRNPRVKKREQYRKALIRRKGAVRDVRMDEGHKYGGETTGIKSGISRSRKLGVR